MPVTDVAIRDESIKLGQFIKLASLVATGGEAKDFIANSRVTVNGEVDTRRGKTLRDGDVVCIEQACARVKVASGEPNGEDDFFDEATANDDFDPEKWRNL